MSYNSQFFLAAGFKPSLFSTAWHFMVYWRLDTGAAVANGHKTDLINFETQSILSSLSSTWLSSLSSVCYTRLQYHNAMMAYQYQLCLLPSGNLLIHLVKIHSGPKTREIVCNILQCIHVRGEGNHSRPCDRFDLLEVARARLTLLML